MKCHLGNPQQELCCTGALAVLCKTSRGSNADIQMHTRGQAAGKQFCRELTVDTRLAMNQKWVLAEEAKQPPELHQAEHCP